MKLNIVFMGTMPFASTILEALVRVHHVTLVVTQPDRPQGRKRILTASPVKETALRLNLPVFQPESIAKSYQEILDHEPDLIVVAAYGQMIPKAVLEAPKYRSINVHASLLPRYRGGAPMQRAIMHGDEETGVSIMFMVMKMDAGPILAQQSTPIHLTDDVGTIQNRLAIIGGNLLIETIPKVVSGSIHPQPQDESKVNFARNIKPEEEKLDLTKSAKVVFDHVRAFHPWPVAHLLIDGNKLKIYKVEIGEREPKINARCGEVVCIDDLGVHVATSDGAIILKRVQFQGKSVLSIHEFMNGIGRRLLYVGKILN